MKTLKPAIRTISALLLLSCLDFLPNAWASVADQSISPVTPDSTASLALAIVKVFGALALVVGLMVLTMKIIRKLGMGQSNMASGSLISILDTKMIAPKKYVAVLRIADELVALGITDQQISLISHLENSGDTIQAECEEKTPSARFSFPDILDRAKGSIKGFKNQH